MEPPIEPTTQLSRPKETTLAIQLISVSLAIGMIRAVFGLTQRTSGAALILAALIVISFFALGFFLVWKISAGRSWARIILLILVLINLPFAVLANISEFKQRVLSGTLSMLIEVIMWVGTCLLFTRNSNRWFGSGK